MAALAPLSLIVVLSVTAVSVGVLHLACDRWLPLPRSLILVMAPFALWSGASVFWAVDSALAIGLLQSVLLVAFGGMILIGVAGALNEAERARLEYWLMAGFVAALLLLGALAIIHGLFGVHLFAAAGLSTTTEWFSHNRGTTAFALLLWPACVAVRRRHGPKAMLALAAVTFGVLLGYDSTAASLAVSIGTVAALLARVHTAFTAGALAAAVIATSVLTPVLPRLFALSELASQVRTTAVYHRLIIWDFAATRIAERPLLGWGFNASRVLPGGNVHVRHHPSGNVVPAMPLHPHNAMLQLWIELGLAGATLGVALGMVVIRGIWRQSADALWQSAAFGLAAAGFVVAFVSYGIWQRWWMSTLWLAAVFMTAVRRPIRLPSADSATNGPEIRPQIPHQVC